ncbi:helix-turn-helix domain-containing protein [uncultured Oscillibacter sp.]|jgi:transcriptional regulator with XRE-family HTH domain|uniref:helix-turn-helix domain-containing protein n=1 Tax=uncultured Oscillibacter sp. TaxID=876091 RepID=UPI0025EA78E0|nr:helix-turn-helix transcriptional regulator [uncultured Oscillibacter sp.]
MSAFSENLKICRKRLQRSQEVVAVQCGMSSMSYRRYESGEREPSLSKLCVLADYFGITLDQLAGREPLPFGEG